jgi:putative transposase
VTETLFGSLKVERLHGECFTSIRQAKDAMLAWLLWSNRQHALNVELSHCGGV